MDVSDCFAEVAVRPFEDVHDVEVFYSENVENEKNDMGDFNHEYFYPAARKKSVKKVPPSSLVLPSKILVNRRIRRRK